MTRMRAGGAGRALAALGAVCPAVFAAGCGGGGTVHGVPPAHHAGDAPPPAVTRSPATGPGSAPGPGSGVPSPGSRSGASRVAYFSTTAQVAVGVREVAHDRDELERFARRVAARGPRTAAGIVAAAGATDFRRGVLVGWTATTGCAAARSASLEVAGDRLELRVDRPDAPAECFAAFRLTVVFEVPKERIPVHPVFG